MATRASINDSSSALESTNQRFGEADDEDRDSDALLNLYSKIGVAYVEKRLNSKSSKTSESLKYERSEHSDKNLDIRIDEYKKNIDLIRQSNCDSFSVGRVISIESIAGEKIFGTITLYDNKKGYLKENPYSTIITKLEPELQEIFQECGIPESQHAALSTKIAALILEVSANPSDSWGQKIVGEQLQKTPFVDVQTLPDRAPAIWRTDKLPGDTPSDFIKRHYGPWLRSDATGLTRPDLNRLDPTLYMALANWLRGNALPADCPVPTKSDAVDASLSQPVQNFGDLTAREVWRIRSNLYNRNQQKS
jgi:hypothetical protein